MSRNQLFCAFQSEMRAFHSNKLLSFAFLSKDQQFRIRFSNLSLRVVSEQTKLRVLVLVPIIYLYGDPEKPIIWY